MFVSGNEGENCSCIDGRACRYVLKGRFTCAVMGFPAGVLMSVSAGVLMDRCGGLYVATEDACRCGGETC